MQSFFLSEVLKWAFLLFSPASVLPLDEFVFTTECHPLRISVVDNKGAELGGALGNQEEWIARGVGVRELGLAGASSKRAWRIGKQ